MAKSLVTRHPPAPKHLSAARQAWWRHVVSTWQLSEHHQHLLRLACEALDRGEAARELLAEAGMTYLDRHGEPKPHPAVAIELNSRTSYARLLRELDLDLEAPPEPRGRPPALRSNARGR